MWRNKKGRGTAKHMLDRYLIEFVWRVTIGDQDPFESMLDAVFQFSSPKLTVFFSKICSFLFSDQVYYFCLQKFDVFRPRNQCLCSGVFKYELSLHSISVIN